MKRSMDFTLIELLVVVTIILVLLSVLMPALSQVRSKGKSMQCLSNLKQIGSAYWSYADDNGGNAPDTVPTANNLFGPCEATQHNQTLCPYLGIKPMSFAESVVSPCSPVALCAEGRLDGTTTNPRRGGLTGNPNPSYAVSIFFRTSAGPGNPKYCSKLSRIKIPSKRIVSADATSQLDSNVGPGYMYANNHIARRHLSGGNIVFLDGHSAWQANAVILQMGGGADAVNEHWHN